MVGLREAISNIGRGFLCSALDATAGVDRWIETARRAGTSVPPSDPQNRAAQARALGCDPDFGGGQSSGGGGGATFEEGPIFTGGQCDVIYWWSLKYSGQRADGTTFSDPDLDTPLYGPSRTIQGPVSSNPQIADDGLWRITDGNGNDVSLRTANGVVEPSVVNFELIIPSGAPDNCGDLPQPPVGPSGSGDITYDGPDGNPVTEPYDIVGGSPIIDVDGNLIFPFEICLVSICFDFDVNLSTGDISFNFGGNPGDSPCCPSVDEDPPETEDEDDPPEPEDETRYVGVITKASENGEYIRATELGDLDQNSLFVPRIGVVRFLVEVGGRRSYSVDYPIKQVSQFTSYDGPGEVYDWRVLGGEGFDFEVHGVAIKQ